MQCRYAIKFVGPTGWLRPWCNVRVQLHVHRYIPTRAIIIVMLTFLLQMPKTLATRTCPQVAALEICSPGASYNPDYDDHQVL